MRQALAVLAFLVVMFSGAAGEPPGFAAIITRLQGDVSMQFCAKWIAAEPFLPLQQGTCLKLAPGAEISVCFTSGKRALLTGPCLVQLLRDSVRLQKGDSGTIRFQDPKSRPTVPLPKDLNLERMGGRWRGDILLFVDPGQAGESVHVRWSGTRPFNSFELQLADLDTENTLEKVELATGAREHVFKIGLVPGRSYVVKIIGNSDGQEVSQANVIKVITSEERFQMSELQISKGELLLAYLSKEMFEPALATAEILQASYPQAQFLSQLIEALRVRTGQEHSP